MTHRVKLAGKKFSQSIGMLWFSTRVIHFDIELANLLVLFEWFPKIKISFKAMSCIGYASIIIYYLNDNTHKSQVPILCGSVNHRDALAGGKDPVTTGKWNPRDVLADGKDPITGKWNPKPGSWCAILLVIMLLDLKKKLEHLNILYFKYHY